MNLWEAVIALLDEGGVDHASAAWAVDLLLQRATATAAEHGTRSHEVDTAADDARITEAVENLSPDTHPHLAAVAGHLLSGTPTARLTWGFEVLINGITATSPPSS